MLKIRRGNLKWTDINMANLDLNKLISHFAQSNKAEGKSPKTVSWYTEMLSDFVKFQRAVGATGILLEFNLPNVRDFIVHEQNRRVSPYTVQGKARALKAFSSWLYAEGYTTNNLLERKILPAREKGRRRDSVKERAFHLFDEDKRPGDAEVKSLGIKPNTAYRYYQERKKMQNHT